LIPKTGGRLVIPVIKFSYLDPAARAYREASAGPFVLTVEKGGGDGKNFSFAHGGQDQAITPLGSDIRYVSDAAKAPRLTKTAGRLAALPLWLQLFPAAAVLLCLWLARLNDFRLKNPLLFRFRRAHGSARAGIESAKKELEKGRHKEAAAILYDSLPAYLYDKTGHKVSGMTMKRALRLLHEKFPDAGEYAMGEIKDLWEKLEALHFHPAGATQEEARDVLDKYSALLPLLEKEFEKRRGKK
jgi:hypothetical protein